MKVPVTGREMIAPTERVCGREEQRSLLRMQAGTVRDTFDINAIRRNLRFELTTMADGAPALVDRYRSDHVV